MPDALGEFARAPVLRNGPEDAELHRGAPRSPARCVHRSSALREHEGVLVRPASDRDPSAAAARIHLRITARQLLRRRSPRLPGAAALPPRRSPPAGGRSRRSAGRSAASAGTSETRSLKIGQAIILPASVADATRHPSPPPGGRGPARGIPAAVRGPQLVLGAGDRRGRRARGRPPAPSRGATA
jgi:hypothetical protein